MKKILLLILFVQINLSFALRFQYNIFSQLSSNHNANAI